MACKLSSNGSSDNSATKANALFAQIIKSSNPLSTLSGILRDSNDRTIESIWHRISQQEGRTYTAYARDAAQELGGNYITTSAGMRFVNVDTDQIKPPHGEVKQELDLYRRLLDATGAYLHRT